MRACLGGRVRRRARGAAANHDLRVEVGPLSEVARAAAAGMQPVHAEHCQRQQGCDSSGGNAYGSYSCGSPVLGVLHVIWGRERMLSRLSRQKHTQEELTLNQGPYKEYCGCATKSRKVRRFGPSGEIRSDKRCPHGRSIMLRRASHLELLLDDLHNVLEHRFGGVC